MKLIWYLPTWGEKSTAKKLQLILFGKFDLGHPVIQILAKNLGNRSVHKCNTMDSSKKVTAVFVISKK